MPRIKNTGNIAIEIGPRYLLPGKVMEVSDADLLAALKGGGSVLVLPENPVRTEAKVDRFEMAPSPVTDEPEPIDIMDADEEDED